MSLLDTASLIVTPNGYKEGKLYSVIPSDGSGDLSVTRATTATRVNSAGLVELVPYNFVLNSETTWTPTGVTITSPVIDPNGGTKAYNISGINSGNFTDYVGKTSNPMPILANEPITFSIYMKGSGTIATYLERSIAGSYWVDTEIHTLSNEWQRFTHTYTPSTNADGVNVFVGNLTGTTATSVDIAFPQIVFGTSALDYQKTETRLNIPRLDYSNGTCPSLLVEPQRTNVALYSSSFDNSFWTANNVSVTANNTTSPDGTQNANKIVENTATNTHRITMVNQSGSGTITYSIYAKYDTRNIIYLQNPWTNNQAWFNIQTGSVLSSANCTASIQNVGDGWYRCIIVATGVISGLNGFYIGLSNADGVFSYTGNGTSGLYIWGAQIEAGSYPTSYIPTTSASVTRNADVISKTGISSLIGQTEGTLFVDFVWDGKSDTIADNAIFSLGYQSYGNNNICISNYNGTLYGRVYVGTSIEASLIFGALNKGTRYKCALAYNANDVTFYVNGDNYGNDTSVTIPALSNVYFQNDYPNSKLVNAAALWKTRLTNTQLAQLTTI